LTKHVGMPVGMPEDGARGCYFRPAPALSCVWFTKVQGN